MRRRNVLRALSLSLAIMTKGSHAADDRALVPASPDSDWALVWHDEFDGTAVDPEKWRIEDAALVKNNELQYYAPDEVFLEDGSLVLRSRQRRMGGRPYTSGLVESRGRFAQAFGRIEVRAQLPRGQGIWPAIWMLPADGTWPPEIDIIELIGHDPTTVHMTHHGGTYPALESDGGTFTGPDFTADFHVFALEWSPERLDWYIDGVRRFSSERNVPQKPFYIILNTAVGGNWPGEPDDSTPFPQHHRIDYVRVYMDRRAEQKRLWLDAAHGHIRHAPEVYVFDASASVRLTALADIGYRFSGWSGDWQGAVNPVDVPMTEHRRIIARFEPDPDAPECLSAGKVTAASSRETAAFGWEKAVDGDMRTRWSSAFSDPQWISVDLGAAYDISAVRLAWEEAHAEAYEIQVSDNGATWQTIHGEDCCRGGIENIVGLRARGRHVRLLARRRATAYGCSLWEFQVYGPGAQGMHAIPVDEPDDKQPPLESILIDE